MANPFRPFADFLDGIFEFGMWFFDYDRGDIEWE